MTAEPARTPARCGAKLCAVPNCPSCKRALPGGAYEPPFPFCSQRCKLVDLHGWLNDRYVVSDALPLEDDESGQPFTEDE